MKSHCNNCELLKKKIELLQEELMERKKTIKCPDCEKRRELMERLQETIVKRRYKNK